MKVTTFTTKADYCRVLTRCFVWGRSLCSLRVEKSEFHTCCFETPARHSVSVKIQLHLLKNFFPPPPTHESKQNTRVLILTSLRATKSFEWCLVRAVWFPHLRLDEMAIRRVFSFVAKHSETSSWKRFYRLPAVAPLIWAIRTTRCKR